MEDLFSHVWIIATSYYIFDGYSNLVEKSVDFFRSAKANDPRQSNQVVDTNKLALARIEPALQIAVQSLYQLSYP